MSNVDIHVHIVIVIDIDIVDLSTLVDDPDLLLHTKLGFPADRFLGCFALVIQLLLTGPPLPGPGLRRPGLGPESDLLTL